MVYTQQIQISLCNYEIKSYYKLKTPSTCSILQVMNQPNQHMRYYMKSTTSALIHGHHLDEKPSCMNIHKHIYHGAQEELMHGAHAHQKIPLDITTCTSWTQINIEAAVLFLPNFCTFPKIQPWDYTTQIVDELLIKFIKFSKGNAREPSKHLQDN